ncbi:MAG: crystallin [Paenibacillaceae bacterium]|nr:crystallin [Paenibacillaceae bacterium]
MALQEDYIERVYAGWLGKVIGVRLGGNIENWTYERIERTFGEVTGYLHEFKNFAADDDTNGPMFFLRALDDYTHTRDITAEQMGLTWLNYAPDSHGFYWWGGYGRSTEHTAYLNLKNGIMAPRSGSIEQNGTAVAEQIGGQIFIDVWGMIAPGNPSLAAEYAEKAASVSHDGNGKYGGMFIAACVAAAFAKDNVHTIIEEGLAVIPADCEYARVTRDVIAFHAAHPDNWRDAFRYVKANYGYDKYPGHCHIIPNSAVIVLSLLYGEGDFSRSINICSMCGWDTDCNVANVGAIIGVMHGLSAIDMSWRQPINDFLCCSSVIGSLNILDLPWCASYIAKLGYRVTGEPVPAEWRGILDETAAKFHFEYPGSTHAFRLDSDEPLHATGVISNTDEAAAFGKRSLRVLFDRVQGGLGYRAYLQTYYRPQDFNDSRYDPSFSPIVYPGQTVSVQVMVPASNGFRVKARLFIKDGNANRCHYSEAVELPAGEWTRLQYDIPAMNGVCIEQAGEPADGASRAVDPRRRAVERQLPRRAGGKLHRAAVVGRLYVQRENDAALRRPPPHQFPCARRHPFVCGGARAGRQTRAAEERQRLSHVERGGVALEARTGDGHSRDDGREPVPNCRRRQRPDRLCRRGSSVFERNDRLFQCGRQPHVVLRFFR